MNYENMSCGQLHRMVKEINNVLNNNPMLNEQERKALLYRYKKINGVLLHKVAMILDECEKNA